MVETVKHPAGEGHGRCGEASSVPLVSVVVPVYNRSALLRQALQSILRQDYPRVQVVVVDDGSAEDTAAVVKEFPSVEFLHQANAGASVARNLGKLATQGQYLAFLDADDLWDTDFLSAAVACLNSEPDVAFACANWRGVDSRGSLLYPDKFHGFRRHMLECGCSVANDWRRLTYAEARHLFVRHAAAPPSSTVIRREFTAHEWDPGARVGEDRLFFFGAVMNSEVGAAFCMAPRWSHREQCGNEYTGLEADPLVIERDIYAKRRMLSLYGSKLSRVERDTLRRGLGESYFDLVHALARSGRWLAALAAVPPCLRHRGPLRLGMAAWRAATRRFEPAGARASRGKPPCDRAPIG